MSKHKKTRKEKIVADYRHGVYTIENKNIPTPTPATAAVRLNINSYPYVFRDVSKTAILTFSIVIAQIALFLLLKNHMIRLPMIRY